MDETIEVGAADDALRFWRSVEAVRQGELRLAAQAANRAAIEQRAGALAGWCNAGLLALGAAVFAKVTDAQLVAAIAAATLLAAALWFCLAALKPRSWGVAGYDPAHLVRWEEASELEIRERMAVGYADGIAMNDARLDLAGWCLRTASLFMAAAPVTALAILICSGLVSV